MVYLITVIAWILTLGIAFFSGMFFERSKWTDILTNEEIEKKAKEKKKEKENEIKDTPAHDTGKYVSDDTNTTISGAIGRGKDKALEALRELSRRNRERRDSGG